MDYIKELVSKMEQKALEYYQNSYIIYRHGGSSDRHPASPSEINEMLSLQGEPMDYSKAHDLWTASPEFTTPGLLFLDWLKDWKIKPTFKSSTIIVRGKVINA